MNEMDNADDAFHPALDNYVHFAFNDLVHLTIENKDKEIFNQLYLNRESQLAEFTFFIQNAKKTSQNMLIVGDAGIGKSNFVYKLLWDNDELDKDKNYSIIIDYRRIPGGETDLVINEFCEKMDKYFTKINNEIEPLEHSLSKAKENIHKA